MSNTTTPQDHKQPKDKPITISVNGLKLDVDPNVFDDLEVVEALYDMQSGDNTGSLAIIKFLRTVFADNYTRVKDALRDPNTGRIEVESITGLLEQVMNQANPNS